MDTGFTIFESIPAEEFQNYTKVRQYHDFTADQLRTPLSLSHEIQQDPRYGQVFVYNPNGLERYEKEIGITSTTAANFGQIRYVLINEKYLQKDSA